MRKIFVIILFFSFVLEAQAPAYEVKSWTECQFEMYWDGWSGYSRKIKNELINMYNQSKNQEKYFIGKKAP